MRSELVSLANVQVRNRFLLCELTSQAARTLHRNSAAVHDTINDVLKLVGDGKVKEAPPAADQGAAKKNKTAA